MEKLLEEYKQFLRKNELDTDVAFYTQKEWKDRGEPFGNDAVLSMTFEGSLYEVLNYGGGELNDEFYAIAERHGYMVEMGYAWSAHFYK